MPWTVRSVLTSFYLFLCSSTPAPFMLCRQCPSYVPSTSSTPSHPTPPPFVCTTSTIHVLCLCCLQPMPDRRSDTDISIPPQKCEYLQLPTFSWIVKSMYTCIQNGLTRRDKALGHFFFPMICPCSMPVCLIICFSR